jgi:hypothetical protein
MSEPAGVEAPSLFPDLPVPEPTACPFPECEEPALHAGHSRADWAFAMSAARAEAADLRQSVRARDIEIEQLRVSAEAPRRDEHGYAEFTCGLCGEVFGTNCDLADIACTECDARRCPDCGSWFGATL